MSAYERSAELASGFGLVLAFYHRDPAYALGLATLSAYTKRAIPGVRVHLVPISQHDDVRAVAMRVRELAPDLIGIRRCRRPGAPGYPPAHDEERPAGVPI